LILCVFQVAKIYLELKFLDNLF